MDEKGRESTEIIGKVEEFIPRLSYSRGQRFANVQCDNSWLGNSTWFELLKIRGLISTFELFYRQNIVHYANNVHTR